MPDTPENPTTPEPVQAEPVAWRIKEHDGSVRFTEQRPSDGCIRAHGYIVTPLYTRPTTDLAERIEELVEALGCIASFDNDCLTGNEKFEAVGEIARNALAALKEVNSHDRT